MTEKDFEIVCSAIDEEKDSLNSVSQDIFNMPELAFKEVHAHAVLTSALSKYGFPVEKHYFLTTAFRAEYCAKAGGPTVAILLEYDALPEVGHACGHNLIAEAGLAAAIAVKKAMDKDRSIAGKLVVFGTPAEEVGAGKIRLIELGAFDKVDAAVMVHPTKNNIAHISCATCIDGTVVFKGKESHAASFPWLGKNALDAAVLCYNNLAVLRQQLKPTSRVHAIITEGGTATNIIPARSKMELSCRTLTLGDLKQLQSQVEACIKAAASATGCTVEYCFDESNAYYNMLSNKVLSELYKKYSERLGVTFNAEEFVECGSTDMGNVSHVVPAIHPYFAIPSVSDTHTTDFRDTSGSPEAQEPTLTAAKALAMTCLTLMRSKDTLQLAKEQFKEDILKDIQT